MALINRFFAREVAQLHPLCFVCARGSRGPVPLGGVLMFHPYQVLGAPGKSRTINALVHCRVDYSLCIAMFLRLILLTGCSCMGCTHHTSLDLRWSTTAASRAVHPSFGCLHLNRCLPWIACCALPWNRLLSHPVLESSAPWYPTQHLHLLLHCLQLLLLRLAQHSVMVRSPLTS